jgi:hypothetical protein
VSACLAAQIERTPTGVRQWWLTAHAGTFEGAGQIPFSFDATLRKSSGNPSSNFEPILAEALATRLKNSENDHSFRTYAHRQNRSLSEILDLTVLVPNANRVTGINQCYVERTFVFTLE